MILLFTIPLLIFFYHYIRNGWGFKDLGDLRARLLWSFSFLIAYLATDAVDGNINFPAAAAVFVLQFVSILAIPHGFAMNMGRWYKPWSLMPRIKVMTLFGKDITLPKYWPAWFFPQYSQSEWTALPMWKRTLLDFGGMGIVGLLRGAMVFLPTIAFGISPLVAIAAFLAQLWQPVAYFVGYYIPFKSLNNTPNSVEWGEFLIGLGWAVSLYIAVG